MTVRAHPLPPAWKAARILQRRMAQPPDIGRFTIEVGASRSALDRRFREMFGLAPVAYHTRVRVRHGLMELRAGSTKVADASRAAGFASVKNFNRAVKACTRLLPSEVRAMSHNTFKQLLVRELLIEPAALKKREG